MKFAYIFILGMALMLLELKLNLSIGAFGLGFMTLGIIGFLFEEFKSK